VQPNIDTSENWTSLTETRMEEQMAALSNALPAPLVIWPEIPAPFYFYTDPEFHRLAVDVATHHQYFLFETVGYKSHDAPLNSAVLLNHEGNELGRYDQINLVPFGEYVPPAFAWVNRVTHETGDFVPGSEVKVFDAGAQRIGTFICYEVVFPELVRQFTAQGANVLMNLSNDGYFGHSEARAQHLAIARMRAVENRRFLIRATNDGVSVVIDPAGRVIQTLPAYQQVAAPIRFGLVSEKTFYSRFGDWFVWCCLALGVALGSWELMRRRTKA
jgi:apolipoprotein N-acyltransferase